MAGVHSLVVALMSPQAGDDFVKSELKTQEAAC